MDRIASEKLGVGLEEVGHYAAALVRWAAAGFPVRSQAEVEQILHDHCNASCEAFADGRCSECGCRVNASRLAVANKIKMATEKCPKGRW